MAKKKVEQPKEQPVAASTSTALSPAVAASTIAAMNLPAGVTLKRHVTLPSLAIKVVGQQEILFIMDAIRVSKIKQKIELNVDGTQKAAREPAQICTAGKHGTGELVTFIVPAVVRENLVRDYPNDSYVGKSFVIQNKGKRTEAQRYNDFAIVEVDVPEGEFKAPAVAA